MRRGLVHALAWSLATGAAVTLSWWGVHSVLAGTVYDPPLALPLPAGGTDAPAAAGGAPTASSTRGPGAPGAAPPPSRSAPPPSAPAGTGTSPGATPSRTAGATAPAPADTPARTPSGPGAGTGGTGADPGSGAAGAGSGTGSGAGVKTYPVDGGRVTFDLGETSAELVSATPASGWRMQVWKQPAWIRVTFTRDGRELSVFCVWHDTAPRVEIEDRQV